MKAELRIGNHIGQGEVMEIKENVVRVKYTADKERTSLIRYEDVQPIPLSEEVLLKCGFNENEFGFHNGMLSFIFRTDKKFIPNIFDICCLKEVKHLHQLQNLFYDLTGEELEVSL